MSDKIKPRQQKHPKRLHRSNLPAFNGDGKLGIYFQDKPRSNPKNENNSWETDWQDDE